MKDLQSHDIKVMFSLYHVYIDTSFRIIKKTLEVILRETADILLFWEMAPNDEYNQPTLLQISICPQVPHLKSVVWDINCHIMSRRTARCSASKQS